MTSPHPETPRPPWVSVALADTHVLELLADLELLRRWNTLPLAFSVLGLHRLPAGDWPHPSAGEHPVALDPSAAAAALIGRATAARLLIVATPQRDHPYNLGRRVASLANLSVGRTGVLLGVRDLHAPTGGRLADTAWGGAGLGTEHPLDDETVWDVARSVRALEAGWPHEALIGDRDSRILVQSDRIAAPTGTGRYGIAGPLPAPAAASGVSVLAWHNPAGVVPPPEAARAFDFTVGPTAPVRPVGLHDTAPADVAGILVVPELGVDTTAVLSALEERLAHDGDAALPLGAPLRAALALPTPHVKTGPAAFPAPAPHPEVAVPS